MADASYDVVVIGGGTKSMVTAMYLAKYGGMDVAVFEARHEIGGGISSEEGSAPGFIANPHSAIHFDMYYPTVYEDFPQFKDRGAKYVHPLCGTGGIFKEDHSCLLIYHEEFDPSQERTAKEIARFSKKDADAWLYWWDKWKKIFEPAFVEWLHTPAQPMNSPDAMERAIMRPDSGIEPQWLMMSPIQLFREVFESKELICTLLRANHSLFVKSPDAYGIGMLWFLGSFWYPSACLFIGGTHSIAHALFKCFVEHGGKVFTKCETEKIITENGRAKGIRLKDGREIEAKKLVLSGVNPQQLCLRFLDENLLDPKLIKKIENIENGEGWCITWYDWALHEIPKYKAESFNPDVGQVGWLVLGDRDEKRIIKDHAWMKIGKNPPGGGTMGTCPHSVFDKTRSPEGKHTIKTETECLPATALSEREWLSFKKTHAEDELIQFQEYAPNMTWDNIIGYMPLTSYDSANLLNMQPDGAMASGADVCPSQVGRFRPVPELAGHKTPIQNLYATGSAFYAPDSGGGWQGYTCYRVIAEDFELRKPWEEKGRSY